MERTSTHSWGLVGAIGAALAGSVCCLGPLVLVSLGASGAWISTLGALESYRPAFLGVSLVLLGSAFYRVYRPAAAACEPAAACSQPGTRRATKISLWIVTALVAGLFVSPYLVGRVAAGDARVQTVATQTVSLRVEGMTCAACPATVRNSLTRLDGVADARVSFDPPVATVTYDPAKLSPEELVEATGAVGYPSHPVPVD